MLAMLPGEQLVFLTRIRQVHDRFSRSMISTFKRSQTAWWLVARVPHGRAVEMKSWTVHVHFSLESC